MNLSLRHAIYSATLSTETTTTSMFLPSWNVSAWRPFNRHWFAWRPFHRQLLIFILLILILILILCKRLKAQKVILHTILLGLEGSIYSSHTLNHLKELRLDTQKAHNSPQITCSFCALCAQTDNNNY